MLKMFRDLDENQQAMALTELVSIAVSIIIETKDYEGTLKYCKEENIDKLCKELCEIVEGTTSMEITEEFMVENDYPCEEAAIHEEICKKIFNSPNGLGNAICEYCVEEVAKKTFFYKEDYHFRVEPDPSHSWYKKYMNK